MPSLIAVVVALAIAAAPPISVDTRVKVTMSPHADFHIRITVEPHPANRYVCLIGELNTLQAYKGCWNAGTRTTWRWMKNLEVGDWDVYAVVERNDNTTKQSVKMRLVVRGPGYEEPPDLFSDPF